MTDLKSEPAEVQITLEIKRAATGKTETVNLTGHVLREPERITEQQEQK